MGESKRRGASRRPERTNLPQPLEIAVALQKAFGFQQQGQLAQAESLYRTIIKQAPNQFDAHHLLGLIELNRRNYEAAVQLIGQALKLDPKSFQAHSNMGNALVSLKLHDEALTSYDRALAIKPDDAIALFNRGNVLFELGRHEEARASYDAVLAIQPDFVQARFARCMAELPVLYVSEAEINERRAAYEQCLKELCRADANVAKGVGSSQPFYLAYQGRNDRDLQALYGSLVSRVMGERYPPARLASPPSASEPVRVGIVSGFFRNHANWRLPIKGWLSQLDRRQFRLFGYYTGGWRTTRQALQAPCANVSSKVHDRSKAGEPKYWPMPHMF